MHCIGPQQWSEASLQSPTENLEKCYCPQEVLTEIELCYTAEKVTASGLTILQHISSTCILKTKMYNFSSIYWAKRYFVSFYPCFLFFFLFYFVWCDLISAFVKIIWSPDSIYYEVTSIKKRLYGKILTSTQVFSWHCSQHLPALFTVL